MLNLTDLRRRMVDRQIAGRGIRDEAVLAAMIAVPREAFVPEHLRDYAFDDAPLPIGEGQTISQPFIVAQMIEAAGVGEGDRVLEIGTGSGYAAAVLAAIAQRVYTIERHAGLAEEARTRLARLGVGNVRVRVGDGTRGWPEAAPFDAIIAAAGGPKVPLSLKEQLAVGGRLVMPVGETPRLQRLIKLTRTGENTFEEENLGDVRFVPLVGVFGWGEEEADGRPRRAPPARPLPELIREAAEPLPDIDDPAFGRLFDRFADCRVVLLGEASHGTAEFYRARAAVTRRLIERHGFSIVAVEADWPDAEIVDRYVRHRPPRTGAAGPFRRFPTWMWRNAEVDEFIRWLRRHNELLEPDARTGFFGLDLYNLSASIGAVLDYLDREDPEAATIARERYGCLDPWRKDPAVYGRAVLSGRYEACEDEVVAQLQDILARRLDEAGEAGEQFLDAAQNARLVAAAERYYRVMYYGGAASWNLRDTHMYETLANLLAAHGPDAKAIVWAHNSHIGDAAHTDMGLIREEVNIGQLCRENFGADAALIGFGTHTGTVAAASLWDGPMEVKRIRPSRPDSYEGLCHESGPARFLLDLRHGVHELLRHGLSPPRLERFIGVIYRPETELESHYADASLPHQFDAWVWFDETSAVTPLPTPVRAGGDETFPFGV